MTSLGQMGGVLFSLYKPIKLQSVTKWKYATLTNIAWHTSRLPSLLLAFFSQKCNFIIFYLDVGNKRKQTAACPRLKISRKRYSIHFVFRISSLSTKEGTISLDGLWYSGKSTKVLQRQLGMREVVYPNVDAEVYVTEDHTAQFCVKTRLTVIEKQWPQCSHTTRCSHR